MITCELTLLHGESKTSGKFKNLTEHYFKRKIRFPYLKEPNTAQKLVFENLKFNL